MIDLHCHILPGVDDGAANCGIAIRMAEIALESGITAIVATPHCNCPHRAPRKNFRSPTLDREFDALQRVFADEGLPLRVLPGCELLLRGDVGALLAKRPVYTLAGSHYLLVEFYFDEHPRYMDAALSAVSAHGMIPLVAHPERYFCVQEQPDVARRWYDRGYGLQLNKGSLLGDLGEGAYDVSRELLRDGLYHVIASDAHNCEHRTPSLTRLHGELEYFFPQRDPAALLMRNPQNILDDKPLEPV